jgi:SAM-dependent MidA family methyltransferase
LQALKGHATDDPLAHPGAADLTAHVDFEALALAVPEVRASPLLPPGLVLQRLGIDQRAETLARGLTGDALASHRAAHRRLTDPAEMGTVFRTMGLTPQGAPLPPGYHDA